MCILTRQRYKRTKYNDSEDKMQKYIALMSTYGKQVGINFDFHGIVANTLDAHRLIQHYQENLGPEVADKLVNSLYTQYFTQRAHPSAPQTLLKAAEAAGIDRAKAEAIVSDEYEGLQETKMLLREQAGNGIDSVSPLFISMRQNHHLDSHPNRSLGFSYLLSRILYQNLSSRLERSIISLTVVPATLIVMIQSLSSNCP